MSECPRPLVTVITPTFNRADYILETIESIQAQSYPNIEHIVVDDGSSDHTQEVLAGAAGGLRVIRQENAGEPLAVNRGFAAAGGDLLGIVNDDDPVHPNLVDRMVAAFASDPDLLVAYPDWEMIDAAGRGLRTFRVPEYSFRDMVRWHYCLPGPGTFFRRRVLDLESGRDVDFRLAGDFQFWLRVALHGPFRRVPEVLATWRLHSQGTTLAAKGLRMAAEHRRILDDFYARSGLPSAILACRDEAYASADWMSALDCVDVAPREALGYLWRAVRRYPWVLLSLPPNMSRTRRRFLRAGLRQVVDATRSLLFGR